MGLSGIGGSIMQTSSKLGPDFNLNEPSIDSVSVAKEAVPMGSGAGIRNREAGT